MANNPLPKYSPAFLVTHTSMRSPTIVDHDGDSLADYDGNSVIGYPESTPRRMASRYVAIEKIYLVDYDGDRIVDPDGNAIVDYDQ
jgi:hypothetical protein